MANVKHVDEAGILIPNRKYMRDLFVLVFYRVWAEYQIAVTSIEYYQCSSRV